MKENVKQEVEVLINKLQLKCSINEFQDEVDWKYISSDQKLSEEFIREFKDEVDIKLYKQINQKKSRQQKIQEIKEYSEKYSLKFDEKYIYAFRNHDFCGRGNFIKTFFYEKGKYYRDWKCDMRSEVENSFGFGIWPQGNTPVKVSVKDWGTAVNKNDGKARVWGFTVLK